MIDEQTRQEALRDVEKSMCELEAALLMSIRALELMRGTIRIVGGMPLAGNSNKEAIQ